MLSSRCPLRFFFSREDALHEARRSLRIDSFLSWGRDNARAFREARQSAVEAFARQIADALIGWHHG
jgi:hypothetical protein